jgi:Sec-independent protein secretion pathway component TatC
LHRNDRRKGGPCMLEQESSISEDTQNMLNTLKDRKEKMDTLKKRQNRLFIFLFLIISAFIVYFYMTTLSSTTNSPINILNKLTENSLNMFLILAVITLYTYSIQYARKTEKAKKKYEDLRVEVIERFYSTWIKTQHSDIRDEISRKMNDIGINVRYKSK